MRGELTSIGYPGLGNGVTSIGWYSMINEAILCWRFLKLRGLENEFVAFKETEIPRYEEEVKNNMKKLWGNK